MKKKALVIGVSLILIGFFMFFSYKATLNFLFDIGTSKTEKLEKLILKKYVNDEYGFEFEYPSNMEIQKFSREKTDVGGIFLRNITSPHQDYIKMYLPTSNDFTMKQNLTGINDILSNYQTVKYTFDDNGNAIHAEVRIHNQEKKTINKNIVVRQIYDFGVKENGYFNTSDEIFEKNYLRYIINNDQKFFILKSENSHTNDEVMKVIVDSFKIKK